MPLVSEPTQDQRAEQGRVAWQAINEFKYFVRLMWPILDAEPLQWDWYLDAICDAVQRQVDGDPEYRWLLVCQPPGTAKSRIMSVMRPAWTWLRMPHRRMFYLSTSEGVAERDSRFTRTLLKSDEYVVLRRAVAGDAKARVKTAKTPTARALFTSMAASWEFAKDQDEKGNFENTMNGARFCAPINAKNTGHRGYDLVVDDPVNVRDWEKASPSRQAEMFEEAWADCVYIFETRNQDDTSTRTMVAQRIGVGDPPDRAMRQGHWKVICVPAEWWAGNPHVHPLDPRRVEGARLPRYGAAELVRKKAAMSIVAGSYEAQFNQRPRVLSGGLVDPAVVRQLPEYQENPAVVAERCDEVAIFVDATFHSDEKADRVAIQCWGREGESRFYLLGRDTRRMTYGETKAAIRAMRVRFPMARSVVVEDAALGPAIIQDLSAEFPGVIPFKTRSKSKVERAKVGLFPLLLGSNIHLPSVAIAPWIVEVRAEWVAFRGRDGDADDDVDVASMMGIKWGLGGHTRGVDGLPPAEPPIAALPVGIAGQCWTWGNDGVIAGIAGAAMVVLDGSGCQVAVVDGCSAAEWGDILHKWAGVGVGVEDDGAHARVVLNYTWNAGFTARAYKVDLAAFREGLLARRIRIRDTRLIVEMGSAPVSDMGRAAAVAWVCGVSRGVFAPPGKDRPLPSAREDRLRRWGIDPAAQAEEVDPWAEVAQRVRAL